MRPSLKIFILLLLPLLAQGALDLSHYQKIHAYFTRTFPGEFSCQVESENLSESLSQIPQDALTDPKNVKVVFLYHKELGSRVIVKGVTPPFADRFAYIEGVFDFIFPFVRAKTYAEFSQNYTIFDSEPGNFKLKKRLTAGSFLQIFLKKNLVSMVKEFKDTELLMNVQLNYQQIGKFLVPSIFRVFYYEKGALKILNFRLTNFDFKPNISEEDFLG